MRVLIDTNVLLDFLMGRKIYEKTIFRNCK